MSVGPDQYGGWRGDGTDHRQIPRPRVFRIDRPNAIRPWPDDARERAIPAKVDQHRFRFVHQLEGTHTSAQSDPHAIFGLALSAAAWIGNVSRVFGC